MNNKLYIVRYQDRDTKQIAEYEEQSLDNAIEIYNSLVGADDVENLMILEYDITRKKYYMMEV